MARNILLKIAADVDPARRGLRGIQGDLKGLGETRAEPLVRLREQGLEQKLTRLQERLTALSRQESTPKIKIAMGQVAGQIQRVERELGQVGAAGARAGHQASVGLSHAGHASDSLASKLKHHRSEFIGFAKGAVGITAAFSAITDAKSAVETTDNLAKATLILGRNFGFTAEEASKWAVVAQSRDVDPTALSTGFTRLSRAVEQARAGSKSYQETFKQLGVSNADLLRGQRDFPFLISKVTEAFSHMSGGTRRAAIAQQVFGRGSRSLLLLLRQGSQGFEAQSKMAEKYGATLNEKTLGGVEKLVVAQRQAHYATTGLQIAFGTGLAPVLTRVTKNVSRFILGMRTGTGAGGRFAARLRQVWRDAKPVIGALGSIVRLLSRVPHAMTIAIGAWVAFRFAAVRALALTRLRMIGLFLGLGGPAATGGAVAGTAFGSRFGPAAGALIRAFGWAAVGIYIADQINSAVNDRLNGGNAHPLSGQVSPVDRMRNPGAAVANAILHGRNPLDPAGGNHTGHPSYQSVPVFGTNGRQNVSVANQRVTAVTGTGPARVGDGVSVGVGPGGVLTAYPSGGGWGNRVTIHDRGPSSVPGGRDPRGVFNDPHRRSPRTAAQIIASLGSPHQVESTNLHRGVSAAERAYVKAVRKYGAGSAQADAAAGDVISARQQLHSFDHPSQTAAQRAAARRRRTARRRRANDGRPATPQEIAAEHASESYAQAVRKYGIDSPQAKVAKDRESVSSVRSAIQTARDRLAADVRKFGATSERAIRDRTTLSRLGVRLIQANHVLADALHKNTEQQRKALLPRLTDVAYHPITGHMHSGPIQNGVGGIKAPSIHHWGGVHITTPGGQAPDARYLSTQLEQMLGAKGNGS